MPDSKDEIASWASIIGSAVALLGLIQSQAPLTIVGVCLAGISVGALIYAKRNHRRLELANLNIEGFNLDSLNIANLRRRVNRSLFVQRAYHLARIEGPDLSIAWQYDGFCRAKSEASIEFSIDSESRIPFAELDCYAFDLQQDPEQLHRIRPMLIGPDGHSKKIAVPFLKPLSSHEPYSILLRCNLPGCLGTGVQYYTSSLSFDQRAVEQLAVHLVFVRTSPEWVRVYECNRQGRPRLVNQLRPFKADGETCEYLDLVEGTPGQSVRIYVYRLRPSLPKLPPNAQQRLS